MSAVCAVAACERQPHARGFCNMHYARHRKHGDPTFEAPILGRPWKGAQPTFAAVHKRLERTRGRAAEFACVDCGGPAREWSYNGADPSPLRELLVKREVEYSTDLSLYEPRCVSCHRTFDRAGARPRDASGRFAAEPELYASRPGARVVVAVRGREEQKS